MAVAHPAQSPWISATLLSIDSNVTSRIPTNCHPYVTALLQLCRSRRRFHPTISQRCQRELYSVTLRGQPSTILAKMGRSGYCGNQQGRPVQLARLPHLLSHSIALESELSQPPCKCLTKTAGEQQRHPQPPHVRLQGVAASSVADYCGVS